MSLISFDQNKPRYAMMVGGQINYTTNTFGLFNFALTFNASNGINRLSATRIQVIESGFYELIVPLSVLLLSSGSPQATLLKGINGGFSSEGVTPVPNSTQSFWGQYKFMFDLNAGDFIEIGNQSSAACSNHVLACKAGNESYYPTSTFKKLK